MTKYQDILPLAAENLGFFTTQDALKMSLKHPELTYLLQTGQLEKVAYGVYRVTGLPYTGLEQYMEAVLRTNRNTAVVSHESALDLYGITDLVPGHIHVTVPKKERIRRRTEPLFVIHKEDIDTKDKTFWRDVPTVTAAKAIRQVMATRIRPDLLPATIDAAYRHDLIDITERNDLEQGLMN